MAEVFLYSCGYSIGCLQLQLAASAICPLVLPSYNKISNKANLFNRVVSTVHAIIMFSRAAYYWLKILQGGNWDESTTDSHKLGESVERKEH